MQIYLVGGAVRDTLLGRPILERDWVVVGATAEQMLSLGYTQVGKDFPVFLHPHSHEEYALARTERKSGRGYTGFVCHASPDVSLEEDLARRDLTINAMAMDDQGHIVDPYGGQSDLQLRQLRHVSPAFSEDPLRILRVARFAARYAELGFQVAPATNELMRSISASGELESLVPERIWKEISRALMEPKPQCFFQVLATANALSSILPGLSNWSDTGDDLLQHAVTAQLPLACRYALLSLLSEQPERWAEHLKVPNEERQLAQLLLRQGSACLQANNAEDWLAVLEGCDALRRPERFAQFLACLPTLAVFRGQPAPAADAIQNWQMRLAHIKAVDVAPLLSLGLKGKDLALRIRSERLAILQSH